MKAAVGVVMGLIIVYGGAAELFMWARARRRSVRVPGVIVGRVDVGGQTTAVQSRSARFRFTTAEGQVFEAVSEASSFPGPKPGKQVRVVYDPVDPGGTAELVGVKVFKVIAAPFIMAGGVAFAIASVIWWK